MRSIFSSSESCFSIASARASMAGVDAEGACAQARKETRRRRTTNFSLRVMTNLGRNCSSSWKKPAAKAAGVRGRSKLEIEFDGELQDTRSADATVLADVLSVVAVRTDRHGYKDVVGRIVARQR